MLIFIINTALKATLIAYQDVSVKSVHLIHLIYHTENN